MEQKSEQTSQAETKVKPSPSVGMDLSASSKELIEIDNEVGNGDKHHRSVRVNPKSGGGRIEDPQFGLPFMESAQKQPTPEEGPKKKSDISTGVLAKPYMMIRKSEQ